MQLSKTESTIRLIPFFPSFGPNQRCPGRPLSSGVIAFTRRHQHVKHIGRNCFNPSSGVIAFTPACVPLPWPGVGLVSIPHRESLRSRTVCRLRGTLSSRFNPSSGVIAFTRVHGRRPARSACRFNPSSGVIAFTPDCRQCCHRGCTFQSLIGSHCVHAL